MAVHRQYRVRKNAQLEILRRSLRTAQVERDILLTQFENQLRHRKYLEDKLSDQQDITASLAREKAQILRAAEDMYAITQRVVRTTRGPHDLMACDKCSQPRAYTPDHGNVRHFVLSDMCISRVAFALTTSALTGGGCDFGGSVDRRACYCGRRGLIPG